MRNQEITVRRYQSVSRAWHVATVMCHQATTPWRAWHYSEIRAGRLRALMRRLADRLDGAA